MSTTPKPLRLHIDWTRCDGRGLCTELLPALLERDDWGYPRARDGTREPAIAPGDLTEARLAVDRCPRLALTLIAPPDSRSGDDARRVFRSRRDINHFKHAQANGRLVCCVVKPPNSRWGCG